ncbi:uncharacterized protein LOC112407837 [Neophocaena asiaeorientalis asiaeorientalis]|uniref:Uncharacterized protein LOC112407837 n=1 Tax=Neophocaena asiaeorientalis asiaeorientalis TaxID=1706337 RepID=A0A341CET3_NEOAA|nr:uncharacterized protein LOC112407837 [Neophocaena asiaeorientalis asiaeorientalis]
MVVMGMRANSMTARAGKESQENTPHCSPGLAKEIQGVIGADCARHRLGRGLRDLQHQEAVEKGTGGTAHAEGGQHQALAGVPDYLLEEVPRDHAPAESRQAQDQVDHDEAQGAAALRGAEGSQGHDPRPERREATAQPVQRCRPSPRGRRASAVVGQDLASEGRLHHEEQPRVVEGGGHLGGGDHGLDPGRHLGARQGAPTRAGGPRAHVVSLMGDGGRGLPAAAAAATPGRAGAQPGCARGSLRAKLSQAQGASDSSQRGSPVTSGTTATPTRTKKGHAPPPAAEQDWRRPREVRRGGARGESGVRLQPREARRGRARVTDARPRLLFQRFWLNGIPVYPKLCSQHEWPHERPAQHRRRSKTSVFTGQDTLILLLE